MKHLPLDIYEDMPRFMKAYITHFGWHFTKKAFEFAVKDMIHKNPSTGKMEAIEPWDKEQVEELLARNGVKLDNCVMYDHVYVANMAKADYYKSSISDEAHLALFVKDYMDDPDGASDIAFRTWVQKGISLGKPVDFDAML